MRAVASYFKVGVAEVYIQHIVSITIRYCNRSTMCKLLMMLVTIYICNTPDLE